MSTYISAAILPIVETEEGTASETDDGGLTTIQESDEISDASQQDKRKLLDEDESENSQNSQSQNDLTGSQTRQVCRQSESFHKI